MIDQVADKNWLLGLSVAILIDARSQSVYGSPEPALQSGILQVCRSHGYDVLDYLIDQSRAREIPRRVAQPSVLQTSNGHVDAVRALSFPPDFILSVSSRALP